MLTNPSKKYVPFRPFKKDFSERTWPSKIITKAPIWMTTDLRDGNQSLVDPMSTHQKLRFFDQLIKIGFKEIEIGFPSASQIEFDFIRKLIEEERIPDDVTIILLTQAREDLIKRTVESAIGAKNIMIHMYNSCAPSFRKIVFRMTRDEIKNLAIHGTELVRNYTSLYPKTEWRFEYSPEVFSTTELDFALDISNAVIDTWKPISTNKMVLNLPSTIESNTPNIYADQIEWMHNNLSHRDKILLSVHPHNDRGTSVAAAELSLLAGADRIEGCLFGNGERTGNVDLITLALNLYTQGISPGLDFSDIDEVIRCAEECNKISVHPRHPYAGDLVFTAFSGSHQDAIKKGFAQQKPDSIWEVPYLPIDPADLGRSYDAIIRVNSQSGKGGVAYLLEQEYGLIIPRRLQIEFSKIIQKLTDETGKEVTASTVYAIFKKEYLDQITPWKLIKHRIDGNPDSLENQKFNIKVELSYNNEIQIIEGTGNGAISAFISSLNIPIRISDYHEHAIGTGTNTQAACYVELRVENSSTSFGVGIDKDIVTASFKAVLSALNRYQNKQK
ncbi:2-isopropylmalate synthase [Candidatus Kinetoplastibacterium sorsogonicusi]|uniref:2-isopropylmalate synthase n=2 Tax=Candidatus Kinetoplastidibacterium kentomonadis TaxID=1576550 RepID=A0A3Q8EXW1_9PROT|nr:2-isopropylmalate synthase [Candidatus Kinetoplastibacterium sorsogonicusi]